MGSNEDIITAPVTADLLDQLKSTENLLKQYNDPNARLNDAAHYGAAVLQLEALAKAILAAQASVSLINPRPRGARFHASSGSHVTRALDTIIRYLSADAANLMRQDGAALSKYSKDGTTRVINQLAELHGRIREDLRSTISADIRRISQTGAELLTATAEIVAKIASGDADGIAGIAESAAFAE